MKMPTVLWFSIEYKHRKYLCAVKDTLGGAKALNEGEIICSLSHTGRNKGVVNNKG